MQSAFVDNWVKVTGAVLDGPDYFPELPGVGSEIVQMFKSSRDGGSESMHLMYLLSSVAATRSIDLSMAYFVPDDLTEDALLDALRRGVKIRMILPGPITDTEVLREASHEKWGRLLQAGAEIYEFQPTMFHCKCSSSTESGRRSARPILTTDLSGSTTKRTSMCTAANSRSGRSRCSIDDLKRSRHVSYAEWQQRPWRKKITEQLEAMIDPQL